MATASPSECPRGRPAVHEAESQPPAETIEFLNNYFALMMDAINEYSGTVNQMVGDGLMAIFGAPVQQEDHRERAVSAALEMMDMLDIFNRDQIARDKIPIQIGIGIASGKMIAGYTGTQHRAVYTCIGDTVNLASRIEDYTKQAGKPILISEDTKQGLPETIKTEFLGPVTFKGKHQAVGIYAVSK